MLKEKLFKKIREEDVIIWAGAGLSVSSGYPSGNMLRDILYKSITQEERDMIDSKMSLMDMTQAIVDIQGSRNHLVTELYRIFSGNSPTTSEVHGKIAKIPHFKNIFTTNYDRLLEQSINNSIAITNEKQIAIIENSKNSRVFKMHGDLSDTDSLIITSSDYNKIFLDNSLNNALWTHAKALIATKTVLFLGYSVEDSNFLVLLDGLTRSLGNNRKEFYFVAPNVTELKKIQLLNKNIKYINSTAEILINELIENIKENITSDLRNNQVSADTFRHFMEGHDCKPVLQSVGESYEIIEIKSDSPVQLVGNIDFVDKKKAEEFAKHLEESPSKPFVFKVDEVKPILLSFSGILLDLLHNADHVEFSRIPTSSDFVEIKFENDFEVFPHASLFTTKSGISIKLQFTAGEIFIKLTHHEGGFIVNVDIEPHKICPDLRSEIEFFTFLLNAMDKKAFTITTSLGKKYSFKGQDIELIEEFRDLLQYFIDLREIEEYFEIKFKNFDFNEARESSHKRNILMSIVQKDVLPLTLNGNVEIITDESLTKEMIRLFSDPNEKKHFQFILTDTEKLELHGKQFDVRRKAISIDNAFCINIDEVQNGGNKLVISSTSKSGTIQYLIDDDKNLLLLEKSKFILG